MPQHNYQICFDAEYPDISALESYIQSSLEQHRIAEHYSAEIIISEACHHHSQANTVGSITEIQTAWLKTKCIEIIQGLSYAYHRQKFDRAVKALFDNTNPDALAFCASIKRLLYQFRLSGVYEVREIITEAYTRGVSKIDAGEPIQVPLAWLRTTCLNVVRDFKREQGKLNNPKFDGEAWSPGDTAFSALVLREDILSIQIAVQHLNPAEQQLICARIFRHLSWQEIGESLCDEQDLPLKPGTARQRGARALKKLRQHYELIRETVQMPEGEIHSIWQWKTGWDWD
ncbi:MAG: RNA polymerase sigma factor [Almyronema sp.]